MMGYTSEGIIPRSCGKANAPGCAQPGAFETGFRIHGKIRRAGVKCAFLHRQAGSWQGMVRWASRRNTVHDMDMGRHARDCRHKTSDYIGLNSLQFHLIESEAMKPL